LVINASSLQAGVIRIYFTGAWPVELMYCVFIA
jgi:hypothetical protein